MAAGDVLPATLLTAEAHLQLLPFACLHLADQLGHLVQLPGADHQIDVGCPLEYGPLVVLRHAANHANHLVGVSLLGIFQSPQRAVDLLFGMFTDAAGVEQHGVGDGGV